MYSDYLDRIMQGLFTKLGIDVRLLISQAVNFLLLIFLLGYFVYKPILKILRERQEKIKEGIEKAERADERLKESAVQANEKLKEAERQGLDLRRAAEERAKQEEARLVEEAHKKEQDILKKAEELIEHKAREAHGKVEKEAGALVKEAIVKVCELQPNAIDDALINDAIKKVARH